MPESSTISPKSQSVPNPDRTLSPISPKPSELQGDLGNLTRYKGGEELVKSMSPELEAKHLSCSLFEGLGSWGCVVYAVLPLTGL